jgi:hypothetical protein
MATVDERLLEPDGKPEIRENFNRILRLFDDGKGVPGPQGVEVKNITGTIDGTNKLTLVFTLTDDSTQTVEGTITSPATV